MKHINGLNICDCGYVMNVDSLGIHCPKCGVDLSFPVAPESQVIPAAQVAPVDPEIQALRAKVDILERENGKLKEIALKLLETATYYNDTENPNSSGRMCYHCNKYFDPDDHTVAKRDHDDFCPIARLSEIKEISNA